MAAREMRRCKSTLKGKLNEREFQSKSRPLVNQGESRGGREETPTGREEPTGRGRSAERGNRK